MGPRSFDRGNLNCCASQIRVRRMLQWGRDLSIAEIDWLGVPGLPAWQASMGPRSFDRGNSGTPVRATGATAGFNGAAIFRSRKYGNIVQGSIEVVASMGPRSFDRGNARDR